MNTFQKYVVKKNIRDLVEYLISEEKNNSKTFDQFCELCSKPKVFFEQSQVSVRIYLRNLIKDFEVELRDALGIIYRDKQIPESNISNAMNIFHNIVDFVNSNQEINQRIKQEFSKADHYIYDYLGMAADEELNGGDVDLVYSRLKNAIEIWNNLKDKIEILLRENVNEWWWSKKPVNPSQNVRSSLAGLARNFEDELRNVFNIVVRDKKVPKMNVSKVMNIFHNITNLINSNKNIDPQVKSNLSRGSHSINGYLNMSIDDSINNGNIQLVYSRLKAVADMWNNFKATVNRGIKN